MRTSKKIITTLLAAGIVSTAAIGSALADFPRQAYGDLNGNEPLSIEQMRIANQKALKSAGGVRVSSHPQTRESSGFCFRRGRTILATCFVGLRLWWVTPRRATRLAGDQNCRGQINPI
jgi:hypothetical protein